MVHFGEGHDELPSEGDLFFPSKSLEPGVALRVGGKRRREAVEVLVEFQRFLGRQGPQPGKVLTPGPRLRESPDSSSSSLHAVSIRRGVWSASAPDIADRIAIPGQNAVTAIQLFPGDHNHQVLRNPWVEFSCAHGGAFLKEDR